MRRKNLKMLPSRKVRMKKLLEIIMLKKRYYNDLYQSPIKIDLGCGPWKKDGFVGIDNYEGETQWGSEVGKPIDIKYDLSIGIPFKDSTVEEVFASHFLEHTGIHFMLEEIHRACVPNAQVTLILPYANSAEGMFPGHRVFLTEKFFKQNVLFNQLFCDIQYEYTPSDEWEELKKHIKLPFNIARKHYFNVCKCFTVNCKVKKQ